jgi:hypothetical protein
MAACEGAGGHFYLFAPEGLYTAAVFLRGLNRLRKNSDTVVILTLHSLGGFYETAGAVNDFVFVFAFVFP